MTLDEALEKAARLDSAASALRWSAIAAELSAIRAALERAGIAVETAPIYRSVSAAPAPGAPTAGDSGESRTYNSFKAKHDQISQECSKAVSKPECPLRDPSQKPGNCETDKSELHERSNNTELHENVTKGNGNCNENTPISGSSESTRLNEPNPAESTPARPGAPSDDDRKALQRRVASYIRSSGDATQTIREALKAGTYVRPSSCNDWVSYDTTKRFLESVGC